MPKLTAANVTEVLVQADYMSGDRNAIASALKVNSKLGVIILGPASKLADARNLESFYQGVAGDKRVTVHAINKGKYASEAEAVKASYRWVDQYAHRKSSRPPWIRSSVEDSVRLKSATWGTQVIADTFGANASAAQKLIRDLWRLDHVKQEKKFGWAPEQFSDLTAQVKQWLQGKGFDFCKRYVILFAKQGKRHAEKAHHFTSILTWRILQERIERETRVIPVATGDNIGLRTIPYMVEFWNDEGWKKIFQKHHIEPRAAQLGMWCFLAENITGGISIVGMRSGMIEVPALLGIRTLYLEEKLNEQSKRMLKWVGKVPTYERQEIVKPAGISQQIYWANQSAKSKSPDVRNHAVTHGGHVSKLVQGFEKKNLKSKQPGTLVLPEGEVKPVDAQGLAKAVFGSGGLAPTLSAEQFMLESAEFDAIIKWIKNGGADGPTLGSVPLPAGPTTDTAWTVPMNDKLKLDLNEARQTRSWSEYFASEEYQTHLKNIKV